MFGTVLKFWFGEEGLPAAEQETLARRWFVADPAFDQEIRARFGHLVDAARAGELDSWAAQPHSWLALLLVLDQFPRNIHRGTPLAFSGDPKAQHFALAGIARGDDLRLPVQQRCFAYLPLEHAEDLRLQQRCVQLFERLREDPAATPAEPYAMYLDYARRHLDVIQRFGRFPHRNAILGRSSSAAEKAYLEAGGGF
ncbi:DUF924 family protein [Tahibacter harae]|uniref:DUF924 domain-containing protein n=1 Tax=Tahibacter harae TaxID=2963937 RepID=A0ABT1QXB7_9GAMM|nr:DUF924 domain-containing protein [Tahibacter harae]